MNREELCLLLTQIPLDATEIGISGHNTNEINFSSGTDCSKFAYRIQKGTYRGSKPRWKITPVAPGHIDTSKLPIG